MCWGAGRGLREESKYEPFGYRLGYASPACLDFVSVFVNRNTGVRKTFSTDLKANLDFFF